jgi:hypothetical protein
MWGNPLLHCTSLKPRSVDLTGSAVASADDGSTSKGGADSPVSSTTDRPTTLPPGIRIAGGLQMAMHRLSKLTSTLSNVLKNASETAQNITQNIK